MNLDLLEKESLSPTNITKKGLIDSVLLSEKEDELYALLVSNSGQKVYLTIGNTSKDFIDYATFLDWEQVPLMNDQPIIYAVVQSGEKKIYKLKLPTVDTKKIIKYLLFQSHTITVTLCPRYMHIKLF